MEQQEEEKKRETCRMTKLTSTTSLPQELTSEILLRLPARSVFRFRCVSKLWLAITTDPYFINLIETRLPSLLICFKEGNKLFVSSIPQHRNANTSSQPIYRYHMEFPEISHLRPTESVHGLICFHNKGTPIVWNPSKRQYLTLTKPSNSWNNITILLGYDPIEDKHKVMCKPLSKSSDVCRVLTLGSDQETWRTVKTNHVHRSDEYYTSGRCIKGVIYYHVYVCHPCVWVIMSFDVRYETFGWIDLPSDIRNDRLINSNSLISYKGKLACVDTNKTGKSTLWILEDGEKHKWSSKDFLEPFVLYDESLRTYLELNGFTHAGELIYVPSRFNKSYYVSFFDLVRRSYRRFEFKGITDDESRPSRGVRNGNSYPLHTFPNHI